MSKTGRCPICMSLASSWEKVDGFNIVACDLCGHGFLRPGVKNKESLLAYYGQEYAQTYTPEVKAESFLLRKKQYRLDSALIKKYTSNRRIAVLDFGCSTGQFLKVMPSAWKKYGYEINKTELEYVAKHSPDIKIFSKISEIKKQKYDLITLRGVIEHLHDFEELFSVFRKSLKKNGQVFICATPDFNSPAARLYRSGWNQICPPLHYHQFTAASIAILFARHGFGLKALHYPYLSTPYADFEKDSSKFIRNARAVLGHRKLTSPTHAYPGTMMSVVFKKL